MSRLISVALTLLGPLILSAVILRSAAPLRTNILGVTSQPSEQTITKSSLVEPTQREATDASSVTLPAVGLDHQGSAVEVSEHDFDRLVSQGLVLVKFGADWCGPCRRIVPELERLASQNNGSLSVLTVDIDKEKQLARRHHVETIPQMLLFYDGQRVDQWTGYESAEKMQLKIDAASRMAAPQGAQGEIQSNPFAA